MPDTPLSTEIGIEVAFYDLDPMGIAWHGNYFRYFELARCALLEAIGYSYGEMQASGYAWPIIDTRVRFVRPLVLKQRVRVRATLEEFEHRLKIAYEIRDAASGERLTRGYTIQVAVDESTQEMCFVSPAPLLERVRACR